MSPSPRDLLFWQRINLRMPTKQSKKPLRDGLTSHKSQSTPNFVLGHYQGLVLRSLNVSKAYFSRVLCGIYAPPRPVALARNPFNSMKQLHEKLSRNTSVRVSGGAHKVSQVAGHATREAGQVGLLRLFLGSELSLQLYFRPMFTFALRARENILILRFKLNFIGVSTLET